MKNKCNNIKWILPLLLLLLSADGVFGQNFVRKILWEDQNSIIRRYTDDTLILYSRSKGQNIFFKASTVNTTVLYITLGNDNIEINDFEVFDDTVYFCGSLKGQTSYALFGMFSASKFQTSTVKYCIFNQLKSFNRMAMFSVSGRPRAAMTASYNNGYGTMVDFIRENSTIWHYYIADRIDSCEIYDDVAVTSQHVVFTARAFGNNGVLKYGRAQVVYHDKPVYSGNPFLISGAVIRAFANMSATTPIIIKHSWSNQFGIVNKTNNQKISVGRFVGYNYTESTEISLENGVTIRDLGYNDFIMEFELLTNKQIGNDVNSYIYHIEDYCFLYNSSAYYHLFTDTTAILSLAKVNSPGFLAHTACGNKSQTLMMYRYIYNNYNCSNTGNTPTTVVDYTVNPLETAILTQNNYKTLSTLSHSNGQTTLVIDCGQKDEE